MAVLDGEVTSAFLDGVERFVEKQAYIEEYSKRFGQKFYLKTLCLHDLDARWDSLGYGTKLIYLKDWLEFRDKRKYVENFQKEKATRY